MSTILRRIIELTSSRPSSAAGSARNRRSSSRSSLGAFEKLPEDVVVQILRLLGPKEAMRTSLVCKSWRSLVSDDRLWISFLQNQSQNQPWESIFFAETNLRFRYPIQTFFSEVPELSFMSIYSQRAQVPGAVIIDGEPLLLTGDSIPI